MVAQNLVYNIYINSKKCAKLSSSNILGNSNLSAVTPVPLTCKWLQHYGYDLGSKQKRFEAGQMKMVWWVTKSENWCLRNSLYYIKSEKYNSFSVGPIVAYVIARENEIKTVKIIMSGKLNGFDNDFIKERVREMYA